MDNTWGVVIVAVVGILATIVAPIWHEHRRWQHEARLAIRQDRAAAYTNFMIAAERSVNYARSFVSQQGFAWLVFKETRKHALDTGKTLQLSAEELTSALARIRLLGPPPVATQAEAFLAVIARAGDLVNGRDTSPHAWDELVDDLKAEREAFVEAVRVEIA